VGEPVVLFTDVKRFYKSCLEILSLIHRQFMAFVFKLVTMVRMG